jgi:ABC-2 type transport system permease protein
MKSSWKKYGTVVSLGWQDSLAYRFNALIWILYAVLPPLTLMLVWLAAYRSDSQTQIGGYNLSQMISYYLFVTALSVMITPNMEWEMAQLIRDGKITPFIVRPIGFFGHKVAQETSYQIIKSAMALPALGVLLWLFRDYIHLPPFSLSRAGAFALSVLLAFSLLMQLKFLLGITAFWLAEIGGLMEISHMMLGLFGGQLVPISVLPHWLQSVAGVLPFSVLYAFPMEILLGQSTPQTLVAGFARQIVWLAVFAITVRVAWRRGLLAYEGYGG